MKPKKPWHHKEILEGMYNDQGLTIRQIAQILKTAPSNILYWMRKLGVDSRTFDIGALNKGKKLTEEEKEHLSEVAKDRFRDPRNHPMYGHRHTEESKRKMSETKKRRRRERLGV